MKLVKIDEMSYINTDRVDLVVRDGEITRIYISGRDEGYIVGLQIKEVVELLESK